MKHIIKGAMLALVVALAMTGQDEPRKTICGIDKQNPTANIDLIQVSCVNYDELRERLPDAGWTKHGWHTQVLIHVRAGNTAYVSVDGGKTYARQPITQDAWGRLVALVEVAGAHWTDVQVRAVNEIE
jgi:hypothetical protein